MSDGGDEGLKAERLQDFAVVAFGADAIQCRRGLVRDNSSGYVETLDAYEREGLCFGVVSITKAEERAALEFGVSQAGYFTLKRVLGFRPFDSMPGVKYQYSFTGSYVSTSDGQQQRSPFRVFVEQGGATGVSVRRAEGLVGKPVVVPKVGLVSGGGTPEAFC